jgi:hypothetical protein
MKMFKGGFSGLLILTFLSLNLPAAAQCEDSLSLARADKKHITRHEPRIMAAPEEDILVVQVEKKSGPKYLWLGLGAAVVLGLVAAGAGGGGGGGGDTPPETGSGNISVGW